MTRKFIASGAIVALKEALTILYWYKSDLRSFLTCCLTDSRILTTIDWGDYKRNIVGGLISRLNENQDRYQPDLLRLMTEVARVNDFSHLEKLDGGKAKAEKAKKSVEALRVWVEGHDKNIKEEIKKEERREKAHDELMERSATKKRLEEIKVKYFDLLSSDDSQKRGYELEKLIRDLFELFDLDPKASFKIEGEQIDGAFSFDGTDYLFEAKWTKSPLSAKELDSLAGKLARKLENTLGLFLSINGYSEEGVKAHTSGRRLIILMDGSDLMAVLEGRIDLIKLLLRKRRHASQTGNIYFKIHQILAGGNC